jgi:hypothetical protein
MTVEDPDADHARAVAAGGTEVVASFFVLELVYGLASGSPALLPMLGGRGLRGGQPVRRLGDGAEVSARPDARGRCDRAGRQPRRDPAITRRRRRPA